MAALPALLILWLAAASPAARAQPGDVDSWVAVRSPNLVLYSDLAPEAAEEVALRLERFRSAFAEISSDLELNSPVPNRVFAFRDEESYAPYKTLPENGAGRVVGQFLSHRDGNYITLNGGVDPGGAFGVVYHEFVHYFVQHNFPRSPLWFNEGLADYYSTFATDGEYAYVGRPPARHVRELTGAAELELEDLLLLGSSSGEFHQARQAGRNYALSWGLVHYLLSGGEGRLVQAAEFLALLEGGEETLDAFEEAFGTEVDELEESLAEYFARGKFPVAALPLERLPTPSLRIGAAPAERVLVELGNLTVHLGRIDEAERHFGMALDRDSTYPDANAGLAHVRVLQARYEEAEVLYQQAFSYGTAGALAYLQYGRHRLAGAQRPRGRAESEVGEAVTAARAAFALALELDPDFAEARAMLGYAYLFGKREPEVAIVHLDRAWRRLPGRMDLAFYLVQAYLAAGELGRADDLVESHLAPRAEPDLVMRAREEVERATLLQGANLAFEEGEWREGLRLLDEAISITTDSGLREELAQRLLRLEERYRGMGSINSPSTPRGG